MDIKTVLAERNIKSKDIAEKLGMHKTGFSRAICNDITRNNPTLATLRAMADAIGCQVGDFFRDETTHCDHSPNTLTCPKCGAKLSITINEEES